MSSARSVEAESGISIRLSIEVVAERPVSAATVPSCASLVLKSTAIFIKLIRCVWIICETILVRSIDFLSLDIELAELVHIIEHLMAHFHSFSGLFKRILMSVNLRKNSTVLQLKLADDEDLSHSVGNALLLQVEHARGQLLKSMLDALGTFFQHLHLLVAQGHVVKHNEQMINISPAGGEVDGIHDTICFLEQIQSLFV